MFCVPPTLSDDDRHAMRAAWNRDIVKIQHDLPSSELFSKDALVELVRENPDCVLETATMKNEREDASSWKAANLATKVAGRYPGQP